MFYIKASIIQALLLVGIVQLGYSDRIKEKMYSTIDASKACYRRLNATQQIGCSSNRGGSAGAIHYCRTQTDLDFILRSGIAPPYVPILPSQLFTASNLASLKKSKKIAGLIIYATPFVQMSAFTHENQCPNPTSSLKDTCGGDNAPIWNPHGTALLYTDIPFPIFYVEEEIVLKEALDCFVKHNNHTFDTQRDRSLCSLQLEAFMYATVNTPTCIRRSNLITNINPVKFCDPLGNQNVWASLFPLSESKKYIFVVARLDATSMFEKTAGAVSPITGIVTLLTIAKQLKRLFAGKNGTYTKNVLFVGFNGETYDYIGSQRFVYDMLHGNFPAKKEESVLPTVRMEDIDLIVELSQLGSYKSAIFAHARNAPNAFLAKLAKNGGIKAANGLPPASVHTFLRNRTDLPVVVLSDHSDSYVNRFYNSIYDNASNIDYKYLNLKGPNNIQTYLDQVAQSVAISLYEEVTGSDYVDEKQSEMQFVDELLHCYLENANCRINQAIQRIQLPNWPFSLYVGVQGQTNNKLFTTLVGLALGWVTGEDVGEGGRNCTNEPRNYFVRNYNMSKSLDELDTVRCYAISMNFTEAVSPAFLIDDYNWTSGEYSTWTESTWNDIGVRLFLKPSAAHENMTIAVGSIVFIFSMLFVYFIKSKSSVLFTTSAIIEASQPANC